MITLLLALSAFAAPREPVPSGLTLQKLTVIRNDEDANISTLNAMVNNLGELQGFYAMPDERNSGASVNDPNVFYLKDIEKPEGVTMIERSERKVLLLKGQLERDLQGKLKVEFLSNGLIGTYKSCDVLVKKNASGYFLENAYTKKPVTDALIVIKTFGVNTIKGICK